MTDHVLQLRVAEERREQAEARARQLEKQVSSADSLNFLYYKCFMTLWLGEECGSLWLVCLVFILGLVEENK